ncbi:uncharacterized protein LOC143034139 [Oratosquilla oratoria]|uniref:uncharacterized protein LOC143034139 n=1 Tax=Oratosquilla oratoria TaxID=337810 RepID=UPI003F767E18
MRNFFVLALFVGLSASVSGQTEPWCRCAAFVTYQHSEVMVYEAPEVIIESCDNASICKNQCAEQLNSISDYGDLWSIGDSGLTVGQGICDYLKDHFMFFVHNHRVYGYYEVCGGAWQYANIQSQQKLCCEYGQHEHCISY